MPEEEVSNLLTEESTSQEEPSQVVVEVRLKLQNLKPTAQTSEPETNGSNFTT